MGMPEVLQFKKILAKAKQAKQAKMAISAQPAAQISCPATFMEVPMAELADWLLLQDKGNQPVRLTDKQVEQVRLMLEGKPFEENWLSVTPDSVAFITEGSAMPVSVVAPPDYRIPMLLATSELRTTAINFLHAAESGKGR